MRNAQESPAKPPAMLISMGYCDEDKEDVSAPEAKRPQRANFAGAICATAYIVVIAPIIAPVENITVYYEYRDCLRCHQMVINGKNYGNPKAGGRF